MSALCTHRLGVARGGRQLIDALDWMVARGELWCVLGQNGVGKTTLSYVLAGLIKPSAGVISFDGAAIDSLPAQVLAQRRGLMPQQQVDAFSSSVLDTVLIGRTPYRIGRSWDSREDLEAARKALSAVGMSDKADADVRKLSGGERQRVALAALLAQAPGVMLLDEPTAHQDVAQQLAMMRLVRELSQNHAVIVSCHDINLAARFATHVLVLGKDRHWIGAAAEVLTIEVLQHAFGCRFSLASTNGTRSFVAY